MSGSIGYQIYDTEQDWKDAESAIVAFLGIPFSNTHGYRKKIAHPTNGKFAGTVEAQLVKATASLSDIDCQPYYERNNLKTAQYLNDNGW